MNDSNPAAAPYRNAPPGAIVTFGTYPQTADGADAAPIRWRVLQSSGGELFLLSEFILDCKRYHGEFADVTWRDCDLRKWLNGEFFDAAFTAAEMEIVKTVRCDDNGEGCPDTEDRVFLLGATEARTLTDARDTEPLGIRRRAVGTEYAKAKKTDGCKLYVYDGKVDEDYLTEDGAAQGCSWWWLRTRLGEPSRAAFVGTRSSIRSYCRVNRVTYGVRPALKLEIQ